MSLDLSEGDSQIVDDEMDSSQQILDSEGGGDSQDRGINPRALDFGNAADTDLNLDSIDKFLMPETEPVLSASPPTGLSEGPIPGLDAEDDCKLVIKQLYYHKNRSARLLEYNFTKEEDAMLGQHIKMNKNSIMQYSTGCSGLEKPFELALKDCELILFTNESNQANQPNSRRSRSALLKDRHSGPLYYGIMKCPYVTQRLPTNGQSLA